MHNILPETFKNILNAQNNLRSPKHILSSTTTVKYSKYSVRYTKIVMRNNKSLQMKYAKFFRKCTKPFHLSSQTCDIFCVMPLCPDLTK